MRGHARLRLIGRDTTVVAVTGSCGKTSATAFLGRILSDRDPCCVGLNSNVQKGMLRTIATLKSSHRFLVQEAGVCFPGDMRGIARLLRPHIAIVTTIGKDHYTSFRGLDATAKEKGLLVQALSDSGVAVLNADDPHVAAMASRTKARVLTYGLKEGADVRASDVSAGWPERLSMTITHGDESARVETALFGDLSVAAVLAAVAGAVAAGVSLAQCAESLKGVEAFERRMKLTQTPNGIWFVDDSFKAPFWSVEKVVAQFGQATASRKTMIFGSFSDTAGSDSHKYRATARVALTLADRVIFVGKKSAYIRKMMTPETEGRLFVFDSAKETARFLAEHALADELVLIKSNKTEHLERVICGQSEPLTCWKPVCAELKHCRMCTQSGLG